MWRQQTKLPRVKAKEYASCQTFIFPLDHLCSHYNRMKTYHIFCANLLFTRFCMTCASSEFTVQVIKHKQVPQISQQSIPIMNAGRRSPNELTRNATTTGPPPFPTSSLSVKSANAVPRFSGLVTFYKNQNKNKCEMNEMRKTTGD